jgi:uncharacterized hydrophobic protein (TIGR00341 family)
VHDVVATPTADGERSAVRLLVGPGTYQPILDDLQTALAGGRDWRIALLPVEAAILSAEKAEKEEEEAEKAVRRLASTVSREELYEDLSAGAQPTWVFGLLVVLSTIVAAIGLLHDTVAVVIGAMVIAPLLGPNLAFTFATAVGDRPLLLKAAKANAIGLGLTLLLSLLIGLFWSGPLDSGELLSRTQVDYASVALALASGVAAVLSISTGVSTALVGVMVAVALMPPAATLGIMLGGGHFQLAIGALMLLAVNVICVNLAAQVVFAVRGLGPRLWFEKRESRRRVQINIVFWLVLLVAAGLAIRYVPDLN